MRENLREKDKLKDYLESHPYNLAYKSDDSADLDSATHFVPMRNYLDVSAVGGPTGAPAKCWGSSGGVSGGGPGPGLPQTETPGNRDPIHKREGTHDLNTWSVVTGSGTD